MSTPNPLLMPGELPAFEIVNAQGASQLILVCDHASNRVPVGLNMLGLTQEQLGEHIGWDPGAADVARILAHKLDAPLVLSNYSRLVIDCNRPLNSPELIPEQSAGIIIPGNKMLSLAQKSQRIHELFLPYHQTIEQVINTRQLRERKSRPHTLLSIHSFTANLNGNQRPWHIGIAARNDERFAKALQHSLMAHGDITVGFNQPYVIDDDFDYTLPKHAESRGLHNAMIEIRQDGLLLAEQLAHWADRIAQAYIQVERKLF